MKRLLFAAAFLAVVLGLPPPAEAQRIAVSVTTVGGLPATCTPAGHLYITTDSVNGGDCVTGSGSVIALCLCNAAGNGYDALSLDGAQLTSGTIPVARVGADHIDALTEIAQSIKTAANDTDPLAVFTGGNPAGNVCVEMNSSGQLISAGDTCANLGPAGGTLAHSWSMWEVMTDGTQCQTVSEQTIASGPHVAAIECADNAASTLYFNVNSRAYAGGTLTFTFSAVNSNAAPSGVLDFDVSCQCRGDSDLMNNTWGTAQNWAITFDTQNDLELASNGTAVTPNGTCIADDYLFCRAVMDDVSTTTQVADTALLGIAVSEN